jgi:hypothetical protein
VRAVRKTEWLSRAIVSIIVIETSDIPVHCVDNTDKVMAVQANCHDTMATQEYSEYRIIKQWLSGKIVR